MSRPTGSKEKNRVRADARDGLVGRGQFRARCRPGADEVGRFDYLVDGARLRGFRGGSDDVHFFNNFSEGALGQRRGQGRYAGTQQGNQE